MGEMDLGSAFDGAPRVLRDELAADLFTATGQTRSFNLTVADAARPLFITLGWTDAPGNTTGAAYNNDLDLTVSAGGQLYKGNVFQGRWSVPGGLADLVNNVESVFLPSGTSGGITITITAANINSIGVPNTNEIAEQDFALVIDNAVAVGPDAPLLLNPFVAGGNFIFSFQTARNQTYRVQYTGAFGGATNTWVSLPPIFGNGSLLTFTNALAAGQRYYRIISP
jgi:hypothetical protein